MTFFKKADDSEDNDVFPFSGDDANEDEDMMDDDNEKENEDEDKDELEEIETKLQKGEDITAAALEGDILQKSNTIYSCPRCKKIYFKNKWIKDNVTDLYSVRTEQAYCNKCEGKTFENFVGSIEIFHKKLGEMKDQILETAKRVEKELEDSPSFEKILNISEKKGILFIFVNTTRLAQEIGKALRAEFHGGIQFEWFERNQYLRVKWYDEIDNRNYFKDRLRALKDRRFGMFAFEDEE